MRLALEATPSPPEEFLLADLQILACRKMIKQVSPDVGDLIRNISTFALLVAARKKDTLMTIENMAIIWGPTVFVSPSSGTSIADTGTPILL